MASPIHAELRKLIVSRCEKIGTELGNLIVDILVLAEGAKPQPLSVDERSPDHSVELQVAAKLAKARQR